MATIKQLTDSFIKQDTDRKRLNTLRFEGNLLYSYGTLIGRLDLDKKTLLISNTNMTHTTSGHISNVVKSAIEHGFKILPVPMERGTTNEPTNERILERFERQLDNYSMGTNFALVENRTKYIDTFKEYKEFSEYSDTKTKYFDRYVDLNEKVQDTDYVKSIKLQKRTYNSQKSSLREQAHMELSY